MKCLFISYELALKLKEKGFDDPCFMFYYNDGDALADDVIFKTGTDSNPCNAPLYQQVADWFREKHNLHLDINHFTGDLLTEIYWDYSISKLGTDVDENGNWKPIIDFNVNRDFKTYNEALTKAIEEALKLI